MYLANFLEIKCKFVNLRWRFRHQCLSDRAGTFVWSRCTRWLSSQWPRCSCSSATSAGRRSLSCARCRSRWGGGRCSRRRTRQCWTHWRSRCQSRPQSRKRRRAAYACKYVTLQKLHQNLWQLESRQKSMMSMLHSFDHCLQFFPSWWNFFEVFKNYLSFFFCCKNHNIDHFDNFPIAQITSLLNKCHSRYYH